MPRGKGKGKATAPVQIAPPQAPSTSTGPTPSSSADSALLQRIQELTRTVGSLNARLNTLEENSMAAGAPTPPRSEKIRATSTHPLATSGSRTPARPTGATRTTTLPTAFPLMAHYPREGEPDRYQTSLVIADNFAVHVVGRGGCGLKQVADLSGAALRCFSVATSSGEEHHVSIRGTEQQIGDALVVLGKRIARKRVHAPKKKREGGKSAASVAPPLAAPATAPGSTPGPSSSRSGLQPVSPGPPSQPSAPPTFQPRPVGASNPSTPRPGSILLALPPTLTVTAPLGLGSCQSLQGSPMATSCDPMPTSSGLQSVTMTTASATPTPAHSPMEVDH